MHTHAHTHMYIYQQVFEGELTQYAEHIAGLEKRAADLVERGNTHENPSSHQSNPHYASNEIAARRNKLQSTWANLCTETALKGMLLPVYFLFTLLC